MGRALILLAGLAGLLLLLTFPVERSYASRAQWIQRVEVDEAASMLFDDAGYTLVGSPQRLIIGDPEAFVPGEGPGGARLVSEAYLLENGIYPLQLKTVEFATGLARWATGIAGAGFLLGGAWMGRRGSKVTGPSVATSGRES
jgi:hypothetical protein